MIQFGACLPRFLQTIWEVDPAEGNVLLSKWDISYTFHRCPIRAEHIGAFTYVVPPLPSDTTIILCINLVLPMGWVNSPDMFCAASETVADIANGYILDTTSAFLIYPPTANTYTMAPDPTTSSARLQCKEVYMDALLSTTLGDMKQQQRVSELTLWAIKENPPSLPAEAKDSFSLKKAMQGDRDWVTTKDILVWIVNTDTGTLRLSPKRMAELVTLLDIPPSQRQISTKKLE